MIIEPIERDGCQGSGCWLLVYGCCHLTLLTGVIIDRAET
jgi:hypothetical protein